VVNDDDASLYSNENVALLMAVVVVAVEVALQAVAARPPIAEHYDVHLPSFCPQKKMMSKKNVLFLNRQRKNECFGEYCCCCCCCCCRLWLHHSNYL
jgi:hypothetical protein